MRLTCLPSKGASAVVVLFCFSAALFTKLWHIIARSLPVVVCYNSQRPGSTAGLREIPGHPGHAGDYLFYFFFFFYSEDTVLISISSPGL